MFFVFFQGPGLIRPLWIFSSSMPLSFAAMANPGTRVNGQSCVRDLGTVRIDGSGISRNGTEPSRFRTVPRERFISIK